MTSRTPLILSLLLLFAAVGPACGERPQEAAESRACAVTEIDLHRPKVPLPLAGRYWGQEIWLSYTSKEHREPNSRYPRGAGYRYPRSRAEALDLARKLCRAVHAGEDIGALARRWSNGFGGIAQGFVVTPHPTHRRAPDARDIAMFRTAVGALTPLIEWQGGFWFARRVALERGKELSDLLVKRRGTSARARDIHIHHSGAFPRRHDFDDYTKEAAVAKAWAIIREIQHGADFEEMARNHNNDKPTRERGGLLMTEHPITRKKTEWIRWGDRNFNQPMLDVILEKCPVGTLWPEPIISGQGVDIVFVLERKE